MQEISQSRAKQPPDQSALDEVTRDRDRLRAELEQERQSLAEARAQHEASLEQTLQINEQLVITSLREQESAGVAARQAAQLSALLLSMAEAVIVVDAEGRIVLQNQPMYLLFGMYERPADVDQWLTARRLFAPDGRPVERYESPIERLLRGETYTDAEFIVERPDGSRRQVVCNGTLVRDERGRVALGIAIWRDVTKLRELEQSREFVYLISHDLRNPLTLIIGYAQQLLRLSLVAGRTRSSVESILNASRRMQAMIDELVESARLESGHITLNRASLDLEAVVGSLIAGMSAVLEAPRIRLVADEILPPVFADQHRIERVVTNLIDNGLKYSTPPAEVVVRIARKDDGIVTSVSDQGLGIAPEALAHLFEPFYRANMDRTQPQQGLGLGLYISKGIVDAHGGRIWATSEVGQGTTVAFALPVFRS